MDRLTEERIAENNVRFREANEHIRNAAEEHGVTALVPFICECPDSSCMEVVRIELDHYRAVRSHPRHFINVTGHDHASGPAARRLSEHDGYVVVEKVGLAGEIAEDLADRPEAHAAERDVDRAE